MKAPAMPMKRISVMTTVSPTVWAERDGIMNLLTPPPSIRAFITPEASAKNVVKYAAATIHTTLEGVVSIMLL
jgi:hypothetical protein